ncbi:MAG: ABC transporter ATP-binding protein [Phycisphaerae bacterium]|nr:ABC transporter ATP-binding protein [Phycisphaerae bacterium]
MTATPTSAVSSSPRAAGWAVDLADVAKTYKGRIHALRGVSMKVGAGEIFGLLGPNGAGKSTLVKILMTVISPSRATGTVLGHPVGHKPTLARVGYLPEHHRFPDYLTGAQVLDFYAGLCGVGRADRRKRRGELLELVGMSRWGATRVRSYSKGMRQRIGIAQALMNDPDLVVLDEPTDGVDPVGRRDIRNILLEVKRRGKAVFLNSHLLSELEMVCDRVAILVQGVVASQGTIGELTEGRQRYEIEIADPRPPIEVLRAIAPDLAAAGKLPGGEAIEHTPAMLRVATADAARVQPLVDLIRSRGLVLQALRPVRPSLEDLFMQAVTDPSTGHVLDPGAADDKQGRAARTGGGAA